MRLAALGLASTEAGGRFVPQIPSPEVAGAIADLGRLYPTYRVAIARAIFS